MVRSLKKVYEATRDEYQSRLNSSWTRFEDVPASFRCKLDPFIVSHLYVIGSMD